MQGIAQKVMAEPGKYSLQQLQQAVQSGSLPAYIGIPLIQEKLKQQKDMQGMEQAQAPQGPSIAEQVMQEAQGAQGVQALPTNLPQQYAGGGIVAFEEGGEVERYQTGGGLYPYNAPEAGRFRYGVGETPEERQRREAAERERQAFLATPEGRAQQIRQDRAMLATPFAAAADVAAAPFNAFNATTEGIANLVGVPRLGRALGIYDPDVTRVEMPRVGGSGPTPFMDRLRAYAAGQQPAAPAAAAPGATPPAFRIRDTGEGILGGMVSPGATQPAPTTTQRPPAGGRPGAPAAAAGAPKITAPAGDSFSTIAERGISDYVTSARNAEVEAEAKKAAARSQIKGEAFEEYKKSLEEEAKQAGAERGQAKNMALFKAGLAMMAGTSRHALENIGKGALLGAEDYQAAVKDLKRAERERRKELSHIEQARRAEKIGDRDTAVREADSARDRADAVSKYRAKALMDGAGLDKQQAMELVKTQFVADSNLFGKQVAGGYQLEAARIAAAARAAAGAGRGGFTENQLAKLRMDAMERVDQNQIRNQVAKQLGFSKVPKPGADAGFDAKVTTAYDQAVNTILRSAMGMSNVPGGGGNPYQGFRIVPEE